jgi:hypothetical protein
MPRGMSKAAKQQPTADAKNPPEGSRWKDVNTGVEAVVVGTRYHRARWRVAFRYAGENPSFGPIEVVRARFLKEHAPIQPEVVRRCSGCAGNCRGCAGWGRTKSTGDSNPRTLPEQWEKNASGANVLVAHAGPGDWLSVLGGWCDGCRQQPTMSVTRAVQLKNQPHKGCPAGNGTWRLTVVVEPRLSKGTEIASTDGAGRDELLRAIKVSVGVALQEARAAVICLNETYLGDPANPEREARLRSGRAAADRVVGILAGVLG